MVYGFFMRYIELALQGNDTIELRLQMFQHQKAVLQEQLKELQHTIEMVNYKYWYYETAKAAGTTDIPQNMPETDVPAAFQKIRQELKQIPQTKPLQNENQE